MFLWIVIKNAILDLWLTAKVLLFLLYNHAIAEYFANKKRYSY